MNAMCMKTSARSFLALLRSGFRLRRLRSRHLFRHGQCCAA
jgi:hypothetical protein